MKAILGSWVKYLALLSLLLFVTAIIYWKGLHGPFLLDDIGNLMPIRRWSLGEIGWRSVIFDNRSGPIGRPISMMTFLLDVMRAGNMNSYSFKQTNVALHCACGIALWLLMIEIFRSAPASAKNCKKLALLIAAAWLWAPMQVSTVLYVVQRMAQLSTLFMFLALWLYLVARRKISNGQQDGVTILWLGVPALTIFATLSKENGLLVPALAYAFELTLYAGPDRHPKPLAISSFFALSVWLPLLTILAWVLCHPHFLPQSYRLRNFTLYERLLTEPRVLWCYVQTFLLPSGPQMSIYHDNFPISTGLLHPWTTLPALACWLLISTCAWLLRRRTPLFAAGIFMFLVGHMMESSAIALEIYFEHRNYFPSAGLLLALTGGAVHLWHRLPRPTANFRRTGVALLCGALGVYALAAWIHVGAWSSEALFYAMQEDYNPNSPRLQSDLTAHAMMAGDLHGALQHIAIGEQYSPPSEHITATIWRFLAYCQAKSRPPANLYDEFISEGQGDITTYAMVGWELLANHVDHGCSGIDLGRLTTAGLNWTMQDPLPSNAQNSWRTRYNLARMIAANGNLPQAESIAHQAWIDSAYNSGIGVFLFQVNASLGRVDACKDVLSHLKASATGDDYVLNKAVATFEDALRDGKIKPSPTLQ
jgi:protein O-mannosyl-transferase